MNKKIVGSVVGFLLIVLIAVFQHYFVQPPLFDQAMVQYASELNKTCPMMVDQDTQFDNAVVLPQKVFQYNYTLIHREKESVNIEELSRYLEPKLINYIRTGPDMDYFRKNKVTVNYYYNDNKGNHIVTISITPNKYK